jgi:hypothetical protein
MAEIIRFPRLAKGEIIQIEVDGEIVKASVVKHLGNSIYKIKALTGRHKGYYGEFKITEMNGKKV